MNNVMSSLRSDKPFVPWGVYEVRAPTKVSPCIGEVAYQLGQALPATTVIGGVQPIEGEYWRQALANYSLADPPLYRLDRQTDKNLGL